jgi:hypothetical protein
MTTDLVPVDPLDPTTPAGLEKRLSEYTQTRDIFMRWLMASLVAGTDYMLLHRSMRGQPCPNKGSQHIGRCAKCGAKATLVKPGAEKIDGMLKLTPRFRQDGETWAMLGSPVGTIALVCELLNEAGACVAEGRGVRNIDQDQGDANKAIKMCQKSAQIDATLRHAGLSEIFTLDLDDLAPQNAETRAAEAFPPPRRTTTPEAPAGKGGGDTTASEGVMSLPPRDATVSPPLSAGAKRSLEAAIREYAEAHGEDATEIRDRIHVRMQAAWGKTSFNDLTVSEGTQIAQWINKAWAQKRGA